jgi:hypothetical protein
MKRILIIILCLVIISPTILIKPKPVHAGALKLAYELEETFSRSFVRKAGWKPQLLQGGKTSNGFTEEVVLKETEDAFWTRLEKLPTETFDQIDNVIRQGSPVPNRPGYVKVIVGSLLLVTLVGALADVLVALNDGTATKAIEAPTSETDVDSGLHFYNNNQMVLTHPPDSRGLLQLIQPNGDIVNLSSNYDVGTYSFTLRPSTFVVGWKDLLAEYNIKLFNSSTHTFDDFYTLQVYPVSSFDPAAYGVVDPITHIQEVPTLITPNDIVVVPNHFPTNTPVEIEIPDPNWFPDPQWKEKIKTDILIDPEYDPLTDPTYVPPTIPDTIYPVSPVIVPDVNPNPDVTVKPPNEEPPPENLQPKTKYNLFKWIKYVVDWIIYVIKFIVYLFTTLATSIKTIMDEVGGLGNIVLIIFQTLPNEVLTIFMISIIFLILTAIFKKI